MHEKLELFQSSFFGSVGAMTKKAKDLDPMNNIRKAAKAGDWTSMLVEYAANKANLGHLLPSESQNIGSNDSKINAKPQIPKKLLEKSIILLLINWVCRVIFFFFDRGSFVITHIIVR